MKILDDFHFAHNFRKAIKEAPNLNMCTLNVPTVYGAVNKYHYRAGNSPKTKQQQKNANEYFSRDANLIRFLSDSIELITLKLLYILFVFGIFPYK